MIKCYRSLSSFSGIAGIWEYPGSQGTTFKKKPKLLTGPAPIRGEQGTLPKATWHTLSKKEKMLPVYGRRYILSSK
jgi:hypothetical protein